VVFVLMVIALALLAVALLALVSIIAALSLVLLLALALLPSAVLLALASLSLIPSAVKYQRKRCELSSSNDNYLVAILHRKYIVYRIRKESTLFTILNRCSHLAFHKKVYR
jgi:hypothetical protein